MEDASAFDPNSRGQTQTDPVDRAIAEFATPRGGVVSRAELLGLGLSSRSVDYRLSCGRLHLLYRGVYAVGHRVVAPAGIRLAAVLAGGPGAVLSHRAAAALWGLRPDSRPKVEITVPRSRRPRAGLEQHQAVLADDEVVIVRHVPVTTVARTILDLAAVVPRHHVEKALKEAEFLRVLDRQAVETLLDRYPRRKGTPTLRTLLDDGVDMRVTRSKLERRFLAFLTSAVLPQPETNVTLELNGTTFEIDCLWREQRIALELDSRSAHDTATAFEGDRKRDRALSVAGWRPIRVTWRQLHGDRDELEADLRALLGSSSSLSRA